MLRLLILTQVVLSFLTLALTRNSLEVQTYDIFSPAEVEREPTTQNY